MDKQIFKFINGFAGDGGFLDKLGFFLATDFLYWIFVLVLLLWFAKDLRRNVYVALITVLVARGVVVEGLKHVISRARPFESFDVNLLVLDEDAKMSFPSGHTVIYFSLAFAFWGTNWFWPLFVLAIIGSLARIFVGVHYPSDILASIVIALVVWRLVDRLFKKTKLG